ncbi:FadR/GntR family transcriptional regulator [Rhodococcus sp. ACS1]|uniref:FadR/GntR family transcriptional regulator n=1 Tax=Rhodococcus sp. ACS1 TaxID=2028570 RepID=UPI001C532D34|nr:FCD domain-containing protein [Rhodococcus sp. ACS1]
MTGLEHLDTRAPFALVALLRTSEFDGASRPDQVMHQLETAIAVGLIGVGERLPPERELAAQLGVTMLQIRHALATLRDRGLIETRRGRGGGSIVCDTSAVSREEVERRLRERSTEELRDLGDLSGSLAGAAARFAAARADGPEIDRLELLASQFREAESVQDLRRADSRFHIGLAIAAQSRRLATATVQIQGELAPLLWAPSDVGVDTTDAATAHAAILEAITDGDEFRAQETAIAHGAHETELLIEARLELMMNRALDGR